MAVYRPKKDPGQCFVALPMDPENMGLFEQVIAPAGELAGMRAYHAASSEVPRQIMKHVWDSLWRCASMIAVLTGRNPNVSFELGLAHALGVPTVLIAEGRPEDAPREIPIDYRDHVVIWFDKGQDGWREALRGKLARALAEMKASGYASKHILEWPYDNGARLGCERVFRRLEEVQWSSFLEDVDSITVAKLRLHLPEEPFWLEAFERVLARGGRITIAQSDPTSVGMLFRYYDERLYDTSWQDGLNQLAQNARALLRLKERLGNAPGFRLLLNPRYPAMSYYKLTGPGWQRLFVFAYPLGQRGSYGPAFLFSDPASPAFAFYSDCLDKVMRSCSPLDASAMSRLDQFSARNGLTDEVVLKRSKITAVIGRNRAHMAYETAPRGETEL